MQTVGVTVTPGYNGVLTNVVQVTTEEGIADSTIETSTAIGGHHLVFLPLVVRNLGQDPRGDEYDVSILPIGPG